MDKHETDPVCGTHPDAQGMRCEADPATPTGPLPTPIAIHCLACGSGDLDATAHPRGDEPVRCRHCGEWNTYLQLEIAAIDRVRRERKHRGG